MKLKECVSTCMVQSTIAVSSSNLQCPKTPHWGEGPVTIHT